MAWNRVLELITSSARLPNLAPESESEGWVDLTLAARRVRQPPEGKLIISAAGRYANAVAGFRVTVPAVINAGLILDDKDDISSVETVPGGFIIERDGPAGDVFVRALAAFYGSPKQPRGMQPAIVATVINLCEKSQAVLLEVVKTKLFFNDTGPETEYAECYLNFDLPNGRVEFHEKAPEYRGPLLRALAIHES